MHVAPALSSLRTAWRTASAPSASRPRNQPWPPVMAMARPPAITLGPPATRHPTARPPATPAPPPPAAGPAPGEPAGAAGHGDGPARSYHPRTADDPQLHGPGHVDRETI